MSKLDSKKWKAAREECLKRHSHCILCDETNKLNVHHLIPRKFCHKDENLLYGQANLVPLCAKHHWQVHKSCPILVYEWLKVNRLKDYEFLMKEMQKR